MQQFRTSRIGGIAALLAFSSFATTISAAERGPTRLRHSALVGTASAAGIHGRQQALSGGGPQTAALIGLIQAAVAPHSWGPTAAAPAAAGNPSPSALQLVDIIQTNVQPPSWNVNGGPGTIMLVPW